MPNHSEDDRSPWGLAMEWSSRVTNIALEMALPSLGGYWLDRWLGTLPIFLILGAVVGFAVGMLHLMQLAKPQDRSRQ
jgi:hypothetical protein